MKALAFPLVQGIVMVVSSPPQPPTRRPRYLMLACAAMGGVLAGLPLARADWPVDAPAGLAQYDNFLGVSGFIIMGLACVWLSRQARGLRAWAGAGSAWALVLLLLALRQAAFAQADYERARLPAVAFVALGAVLAAGALWMGVALRRTPSDSSPTS
jgi:hypothetical protein